jgi:hypothetical protein
MHGKTTFKIPLDLLKGGWEGVVGVMTRYGLNGLAFELRWEQNFPDPPIQAQPYVKCVPGLFPGVKLAGAWR